MNKEYIAPEMEVMEINYQNELLMGSNLGNKNPNNDESF